MRTHTIPKYDSTKFRGDLHLPYEWSQGSPGRAELFPNKFWEDYFGLPKELRLKPLPEGKYIFVFTDPTEKSCILVDGRVPTEAPAFDASRGSNGFYLNVTHPEDIKKFEPTKPAMILTMKEAASQGHLVLITTDMHYNPEMDDKANRKINYKGEMITVKEYERKTGIEVVDAEFPLFGEHSTYAKVKLLDEVEDLIRNQQKVPVIDDGTYSWNIIPLPKLGLTLDVPHDKRGKGSNLFDDIVKFAYYGRDKREDRVVFIGGKCSEYSAFSGVFHALDMGYKPTVLQDSIDSLNMIPKEVMSFIYKNLYAADLCDGWPSVLGPEPEGYKKIHETILENEYERFEKGAGKFAGWNDFERAVKEQFRRLPEKIKEKKKKYEMDD